jgi:hypothetical protein
VRFVPSAVTLEELARFWSGFLQRPYTVSTLYEAMTVILTASEHPTATLPVQKVGGGPGSLPPQLGPLPTVQFTQSPPTVVPVTGTGLTDQQQVEVAGQWAPLEVSPAGGLQFTLPTNVAAGAQSVILGTSAAGQAPQPIVGSEPQVLRIRPEIMQAALAPGATSVTVTVDPPLQAGQAVVLSLVPSGPGADPVADSVQLPLAINAPTTQPTFTLSGGLGAGQYLTILEVDGVASMPTMVGGVYAEPAVTVP